MARGILTLASHHYHVAEWSPLRVRAEITTIIFQRSYRLAQADANSP
ncbi:hypothetical protein [Sulfobacillus sp. hq2]|nr:hypothetical protein [Sulfobacillus sp. hq2]